MNCTCSNTSNKCLYACERMIDIAQDVIAKCSGMDSQECAQKIGEIIAQAELCLKACNNAIEHCRHGIADLYEKDAVHVAQECIAACEKTVAAIEMVLGVCRAGKPECLDMCSRLIAACSNCAESCRKCIAMGI